jgi:Carboxypeptidase regulatory-like domain
MRRRALTIVAITAAAATAYGSPVAAARTRLNSGVAGRVTAGPTCPVEQVGHPCPPQPVSGTIKAQKASRTVAHTRSDANGNYSMPLAPGRYTLVVQTGSTFPRCPTTPVTVPRGQVVTVNITCDTGIR